MVRLYGRGPRGERVIDDVPQGTWKTITFVAALRHDKMVAPMVFDGPMTGQMFLAYVEHPEKLGRFVPRYSGCNRFNHAFAQVSRIGCRHALTPSKGESMPKDSLIRNAL